MKLRSGEWLVLSGAVVISVVAVMVGRAVLVQPPRVHYVYHDTSATRQGEAVYRREGCNACHKIFGNGYGYGPSLDGVGSKRSQYWLRSYLSAPWPGVSTRRYRLEMPAYKHLSSEDFEALLDYLQALKEAQGDVGTR